MTTNIKQPIGKLGSLLPRIEITATTVIADVFAVNKGMPKPIGSTTQMRAIRLGKRKIRN